MPKRFFKNNLLVTFLAIIVVIFGLAFVGLPRLIPIFIVLLTLIFYVRGTYSYLYTLFLLLLPLREFVDPGYMLPGNIHAIYFPSFFSMMALLKQKQIEKKNQKLSNLIKYFALFIILYFIYFEFKNVYLNVDLNAWKGEESTLSYAKAIRRTIKYLFFFLPLYFIPNKVHGKALFEIMKTVIVCLVIVLFLSQVFAETLSYNVRDEVAASDFSKGVASRVGGLFAYGDVNSLGAAYVLIFMLYYYIKNTFNISYYSKLLLPVLIFGILYTISRGAMLGLAMGYFIYFIYTSKLSKIKIIMAVGIGLLGLISFLPTLMDFKLIQVTLERFSDIGSDELQTSGNGLRIGGWIYYANHIISNPLIILRGTDHILLTSPYSYGYARVPHNIYLTLLFNGGIVFLSFYLFIVFFKINEKNVLDRSFKMIYFPFLFMTFLLSDFGGIIFLVYVLIAIFSVEEVYIAPNLRIDTKIV